MRTEGALTPAPPPGCQREDSRARGSALPPAGRSRFPPDVSLVSTTVKPQILGGRDSAGRGRGSRNVPVPFSKIKTKLSALAFPLKTASFHLRGGPCKARQRARGFHAPPAPRLQLPGPRCWSSGLGRRGAKGIVTRVVTNARTPGSSWLGSQPALGRCYVSLTSTFNWEIKINRSL